MDELGGAQELRVLAFLRKDFPSQSAIATHRASLSLRFARALVEPVLLPLELGLVVHLVVDAAVWTWSATRNDYLWSVPSATRNDYEFIPADPTFNIGTPQKRPRSIHRRIRAPRPCPRYVDPYLCRKLRAPAFQWCMARLLYCSYVRERSVGKNRFQYRYSDLYRSHVCAEWISHRRQEADANARKWHTIFTVSGNGIPRADWSTSPAWVFWFISSSMYY